MKQNDMHIKHIPIVIAPSIHGDVINNQYMSNYIKHFPLTIRNTLMQFF